MAADDLKLYSLEEVAKNNGKDGAKAWIVIKDKIYDVGSFMHEHPGGFDLIEEVLGKDATKDFNDAGHSGDAINMLKKMKIGELIEEDRKHGKKKKKSTTEDGEKKKKRSCISIMTCGVC